MEARELRLGEIARTAIFECSPKCVCVCQQCHFEEFIKAKVSCLLGVQSGDVKGMVMGLEAHASGNDAVMLLSFPTELDVSTGKNTDLRDWGARSILSESVLELYLSEPNSSQLKGEMKRKEKGDIAKMFSKRVSNCAIFRKLRTIYQ